MHKRGEAAAESTMRELEGTATKADFDPLMSAFWAVVNNASHIDKDKSGSNPLYLRRKCSLSRRVRQC